MQVNPDEIKLISQLVSELCGVVLDETKGYLIESRLGRLVEESGSKDFSEFHRKARSSQLLKNQIVDAITTQETLFFRDNSPFDALKYKAIPEAIDSNANTPFPKRLRIWSAACSTGQEPYSIAMTLCEMIPDIATWDINILATDICDSAITKASMGRYATHEIQRGMSNQMLEKYFTATPNGWRVNDQLRSLVRFDHRNLLQPLTGMGPFDIVFCRNVAIYFETKVKRDLYRRIANCIKPSGYLFVGSSEALASLDPRFVAQHHCRGVFYQPNLRQPAKTSP